MKEKCNNLTHYYEVQEKEGEGGRERERKKRERGRGRGNKRGIWNKGDRTRERNVKTGLTTMKSEQESASNDHFVSLTPFTGEHDSRGDDGNYIKYHHRPFPVTCDDNM